MAINGENRMVKTRTGYREYFVFDSLPKGFKEILGATTAPAEYKWIYNGKSLFSKERISGIIREEVLQESINKEAP